MPMGLDQVLPEEHLEGIDLAPTADEICKAARGFKPSTALGVDSIRPRAFGHLSDGGLEALGLLLL
eukprot:136207-Pyramimonas_sp.AAC.1